MAVEYDEYGNVYEVKDKPVIPAAKLPPLPDTPGTVEQCAAMLPEVLKMYRAIVNDLAAPHASRIAAGLAIENRALGKAKVTESAPSAPKDETTKIEITLV